jgi:hypothetical protein
MSALRLLVGTLLSCLAVSSAVLTASAQPAPPATFYGTVAVDGEPPPDGTDIRGFVGGVDCTQLEGEATGTIFADGVSQYSVTIVHESQRAGCGAEGREVTFTIGGQPANQSATWQSGTQQLNLSTGEGEPPPLPAATVGETPASPPTDDVDPSSLVGGQPADRDSNSGTGGNSALPWILAVAAAAVGIGVITGMTMARRKRTGL